MGQKDPGICQPKFRQAFNMVWGSECQVANIHLSFGFGSIVLISYVQFVWHLTFIYAFFCHLIISSNEVLDMRLVSYWMHLFVTSHAI